MSSRVPAELTYDCRSCKARHIAGNVWQHSGLAGGVEVESRGRDAMLGPIPDAPPQPTENEGIGDLITTYLRLLGPATPMELGKYLGSSTAEMKSVWPEGLAEVRVDGRKAWLPDDSVAALTGAERPSGVRLLPPMDPLLQARDRDLLVPDRLQQKEVWRILGNPGMLLLDGEIVRRLAGQDGRPQAGRSDRGAVRAARSVVAQAGRGGVRPGGPGARGAGGHGRLRLTAIRPAQAGGVFLATRGNWHNWRYHAADSRVTMASIAIVLSRSRRGPADRR